MLLRCATSPGLGGGLGTRDLRCQGSRRSRLFRRHGISG